MKKSTTTEPKLTKAQHKGLVISASLIEAMDEKKKEGMKIKHITMSKVAHDSIKAFFKKENQDAYDDLSKGNFVHTPCAVDKDLSEDTFVIAVSQTEKKEIKGTTQDIMAVLKYQLFWTLFNSLFIVLNSTGAVLDFKAGHYWWFTFHIFFTVLFIFLLLTNLKKVAKLENKIESNINL